MWVVFHKTHTGVKSLPYEDFVRCALRFGWIDSLVKRLDDDRFAIKATPRKPASKWSDINRRRWAELKTAGVLMPAGLAAAPTGNKYAPKPDIPELPGYIGKALKSHPAAWSFFQRGAGGEGGGGGGGGRGAGRRGGRGRRSGESLALLAAGRKLGLK